MRRGWGSRQGLKSVSSDALHSQRNGGFMSRKVCDQTSTSRRSLWLSTTKNGLLGVWGQGVCGAYLRPSGAVQQWRVGMVLTDWSAGCGDGERRTELGSVRVKLQKSLGVAQLWE